MSGLAARQEAFITSLVGEEEAFPDDGDDRRAAGMQVYRNAYRARLVDALADTFERTARLAGEEAFRQAAVHHLIVHPPASWTLDLAGAGFPETCRELFANDPDVSEIAWLEWAMHCAFVARDAAPMTAREFSDACSELSEVQWSNLRLELLPGTAIGVATHHLPKLWSSLKDEAGTAEIELLPDVHDAVVWREGESPVFILVAQESGRALQIVQSGGTLGDMCSRVSPSSDSEAVGQMVSGMLRNWLDLGLIHKIRKGSPTPGTE